MQESQDDIGPWLRPVLTRSEHQARLVLDEIFEHSGFLVLPNQKLSQIIYKRPPGVTYEQWNYATRAQFDFVVCDATTYVPQFAVKLDDPTHRKPEAQRRDRMKDAFAMPPAWTCCVSSRPRYILAPMGGALSST